MAITDKQKEYNKAFYKKNSKKLIEDMKGYRKKNPERCKEIQKAWYERNKEKILEKRKNKNDPAEFREYIRQLIKEYEENE